MSDYYVFTDAGGHDKGVEKIFTGNSVTDGVLQIDFIKGNADGVIMVIVVSSE